VLVEDRALDNGLVRVEVDARGELTVNGIGGMNRLVDDGDFGDTYNYSPPDRDIVVDEPTGAVVDVLERGPVRGRIRVTRPYVWPESIVAGERTGRRDVVVTSDIAVHADERVVRIETSLDNVVKDHRLRAWFPLPAAATTSTAECAFATVQRGLTAEGGPHEHGLPTFPSRRFVSAAGVTVLHEGLLEYELVDEGRALALTLLRSIGMLSRPHMTYRSRPAGPSIPAEGAQVQGRRTLRYAVAVGEDLDPYALADDVFVPLDLVTGLGGGDRPATGTMLAVEGAQVSAVVRRHGALDVRVFNPADRETTVSIPGRLGTLVDLAGRELEPFADSFRLRPYGIATVRLTDVD
jgi:alpha-mannosidase